MHHIFRWRPENNYNTAVILFLCACRLISFHFHNFAMHIVLQDVLISCQDYVFLRQLWQLSQQSIRVSLMFHILDKQLRGLGFLYIMEVQKGNKSSQRNFNWTWLTFTQWVLITVPKQKMELNLLTNTMTNLSKVYSFFLNSELFISIENIIN